MRRSELVPTVAPSFEIAQLAADDGVVGIGALRNGGDGEAFGKLGRKVLHAVNREIDAAVEQSFFDLLGEEALAADLVERHVLNLVAGGFDDFDPAFHARALPDVP